VSEEIILDGRVLSAQTKYLIVHDKLIDSAIKLLNKKSVDVNTLSVSDVCKEAKVATSSGYNHFPNGFVDVYHGIFKLTLQNVEEALMDKTIQSKSSEYKVNYYLLSVAKSVVALGEAARLTLFHYREMASLEGFVFGEPKLLLDAMIKDYCREHGVPKYKVLVEDTWISFNGLLYIWMRFDKNSELFSKYDDEWFLKSIKNLFKKQLSSHLS
jgi:AcrR family transcriptional regulator